MIPVLKHMNGGTNFWRWIHREQEAVVIVNASAAQQCKCEKDKICLPFFHLFLLAVEPLAMKICQEDKMPGIKLATQ